MTTTYPHQNRQPQPPRPVISTDQIAAALPPVEKPVRQAPPQQQQPRRAPVQRRSLALKALATLPFVGMDFDDAGEARLSMWAVEPSGDFADDNKTGVAYAVELTQYMSNQQVPTVFAQVVKAIQDLSRYRPWSGVEVGFFQAMASFAMTATAPTVAN